MMSQRRRLMRNSGLTISLPFYLVKDGVLQTWADRTPVSFECTVKQSSSYQNVSTVTTSDTSADGYYTVKASTISKYKDNWQDWAWTNQSFIPAEYIKLGCTTLNIEYDLYIEHGKGWAQYLFGIDNDPSVRDITGIKFVDYNITTGAVDGVKISHGTASATLSDLAPSTPYYFKMMLQNRIVQQHYHLRIRNLWFE